MVRPKKPRLVSFQPLATYFKPRNVPMSMLEEVELTIDELESMRLSDLAGIGQERAAGKMGIHQSTFQRTLEKARYKVTDALVNGKAIMINGGAYKMPEGDGTGPIGQGRGRFRGWSGVCICPTCGYEMPHARGQPCNQLKCPKCSSQMTRGR